MPRAKVYKINLTEKQITDFKNALHTGCPLMVALSYAKIHPTVYFYYVDIANIAAYYKEQEMIKEEVEMMQSGIEISNVKDNSHEFSGNTNISSESLRPYKIPTPASLLRYKNNKSFAMFCNEVYELLEDCDKLRAEVAMFHLQEIMKHSGKRGVNTTGSQWYLERTMPDYFGKVEKSRFEGSIKNSMTIGEDETNVLPPIKVEFVDPNTRESQDRVRDMQEIVEKQLLGKSQA